MNGTRLQSAICDRIHPGVSSYVTVHTVKIECEQGTDPNEEQLVFIIEVRAGNTAYQAVDKRYYVRRGTEASERVNDFATPGFINSVCI